MKFPWQRRTQQQLEHELQSHLHMAEQDRRERGESAETAAQAARREFGNVGLVQQVTREQWGWTWLDDLHDDLRFGLRTLGKSPGFVVVVIFTLALGIGANSAIFSLVNAALLRALPARDADRLMLLEWHAKKNPEHWSSSGYGDCVSFREQGPPGGCSLTAPFYKEIRQRSEFFSSVAAFAGADRLDLTIDGTAEILENSEYISGEYFETFGVRPAVGRLIDANDDQPSGASVAVLGYEYWRTKFASSPSVVGRTITLNRVPCTIIGVAEPGFETVTPGKHIQAWFPLSLQPQLDKPWDNRELDPNYWWLVVVGRLRPGVAREQAQTALSSIFRTEMTSGPKPPFKPEDDASLSLTPAARGLTGNRPEFSAALYSVWIAVGFVLLIACANVAGLLLSRSTARQREMAIRFALGASSGRILRQLLTESLILSLTGGGLGTLFASWCVASVMRFIASAENGVLPFSAAIDTRVLVFTAAISTLTGLLFGLAPALRGIRLELTPVLKQGSDRGQTGRKWFSSGNALVIVQVALSIVVLAGAGLLIRTLQNLKNVDPGFDTANVLTFSLEPSLVGYKEAELSTLCRELQVRFAALPGVASVTYSSWPLLAGALWTTDFHLPGRPKDEKVKSDAFSAGPGFFATMRIPLLEGRDFNALDFERAQAAERAEAEQEEEMAARLKQQAKASTERTSVSVLPIPAIVNRAFVEKYLPKGSPLGQKLGASDANFDVGDLQRPGWEIVGVVADVKYNALRRDVHPTIYVPHSGTRVSFSIRAAGEPRRLVPQIRSIVSQVDNSLPVFEIATEKEQIEHQLFSSRLIARLSGFFGGLALLLSCIGLYGLLSYEVAQRTREIGIRTALGANRSSVLRLVLTQGMGLTVIGGVLGITLALALTRYAETLLYGVKPSDPLTFAGVGAILLGVTLLACFIPARRATRVDPMIALRYE